MESFGEMPQHSSGLVVEESDGRRRRSGKYQEDWKRLESLRGICSQHGIAFDAQDSVMCLLEKIDAAKHGVELETKAYEEKKLQMYRNASFQNPRDESDNGWNAEEDDDDHLVVASNTTSGLTSSGEGANEIGRENQQHTKDNEEEEEREVLEEPYPYFGMEPLEVDVEQGDSAKGIPRSCAAIVCGSIQHFNPKVTYTLIAYLLEEGEKSNNNERKQTEVQRMDLDDIIDVEEDQVHCEGQFRVKVAGLRLGGHCYLFDIVGTWSTTSFTYLEQHRDDADAVRTVSTMRLKPTEPNNFHCSGRSKTGIKLRWQKPICDGGSKICEYRVQQLDDENDQIYNDVYIGSDRSFQISKLRPGRTYSFRICAKNVDCGDGPWSDLLQVTTMASVPEPPGMPFQVTGNEAPRQLHLRWEEPKEDNGAPVKSYSVEICMVKQSSTGNSQQQQQQQSVLSRCSSTDFTIADNVTDNTCTITEGIQPASSFYVRVRAENDVGYSQYSPIAQVATIGMAPEPPGKPQASFLEKEQVVQVSWELPTLSHGSPIKNYTLEYRKADEENDHEKKMKKSNGKKRSREYLVAYKGPKQPCKVTCFHFGESYVLRVLALNSFGWSDPSAESVLEMPAFAPNAPVSDLQVKSVDIAMKRVKLIWKPMDATQCIGAPLQGYIVWGMKTLLMEQQRDENDQHHRIQDPAMFSSITSNEQDGYTLSQVLTTDTFKDMEEISERVDGASKKQKYQVGDILTYMAPQAECYYLVRVVQYVAADQKYLIEYVEYENAKGGWVDQTELKPRLKSGDTCRALNYTSGKLCDAVITSVTNTGYWIKFPKELLPRQETRVADVEAFDQQNDDDDNDDDTSSVTTSVITSVEDEMTTRVHGASDTDAIHSDVNKWVQLWKGKACQCDIKNLEEGMSYSFKYAAFNEKGISPCCENILKDVRVGARKPSRCGVPKLVNVSRSSFEIELAEPSNLFGLPLKGWHIGFAMAEGRKLDHCSVAVVEKPIAWKTITVNEPRTTIQVNRSGGTYVFRVRGFTDAGFGPWCKWVAFKTVASVPDGPKKVSIHVKSEPDARTLVGKVTWIPEEWNGGKPTVGYEVQVHENADSGKLRWECTKSVAGTDSECVFSGLRPGMKNLVVRVAARNECGIGTFSSFKFSQVPSITPDVVRSVSVSSTGPTWVKCAFEGPTCTGGEPILGYDTETLRLQQDEEILEENVDFEPTKPGVIQFHATNSNQVQLKGLEPGARYIIRVRAVNSVGGGKFSKWIQVETAERPSSNLVPPSNLRPVSLSPLSFEWDWEPGHENAKKKKKKNDIIPSNVEYMLDIAVASKSKKRPEFQLVYRGSKKSFTLDNVEPDTLYKARVRVGAKSLGSGFSSVCSIRTPATTKDEAEDVKQATAPFAETEKVVKRSRKKAQNDDEPESAEIQLQKASKAVRRRKMRWYRRYPKLAMVCFGLVGVLISYFVYSLKHD